MFVIELDMVVCIVLRLDVIAAVGRLRRASVVAAGLVAEAGLFLLLLFF